MIKLLCSTLSLLALAGCNTPLLPANVAPVVPMTHSVEQADSTLRRVEAERAQAEARYAASEQLCYKKFFVNNCLDQAKEERRGKLEYLTALENEAQYFKRKAAVDERDRKLAEAQKEFEAEEARRAAEPAAPAPEPVAPRAPRGRLAERQAEHAARLARQADKERAKAAAAPAKIAAFDKQQAAALARQRKVAERKAERARKQAEKEAAAKAEQAKADEAKAAAAKTGR